MLIFSDKSFSLKTPIGWSMEHCTAGFLTDRGPLRVTGSPTRDKDVEHCFHVKRISEHSVEFWMSARNLSSTPLAIEKIVLFDGSMGVSGGAWEAVHGECFKKEEYFNGYSYYSGSLVKPLREMCGTYGKSEDTPFPGIFFMHPEKGGVLVSVLSQERCKPCWTFDGKGGLSGEDTFSGIPRIPLKPGATLETEHWVLMVSTGGVEDLIDAYYGMLKERYSFPGADSPLRREVVWGSWNYNSRPGGYGDITHDYILDNAKALAEHHRKVRWVMIDHGYQYGVEALASENDHIGIDTFHDSLPSFHSPTRFPLGMRGMATGITDAGMKPAIWSSPKILSNSNLARQRPEWLLRIAGDKIFSGSAAYLDYSIPEVREYVKAAWNTIFNDWGFKGLKLDFWTPAFEIPDLEYANRDLTAVQLRNLFLKDVHDMKPQEGFLLTCCTVNAGNPFLGLYADASRIGLDVGTGAWDCVARCAKWLSVSSLFFRGDCLLADADSVGWNNNLSENENRMWATLTMMTGGMCEIGGDMTRLTHQTKPFYDSVIDLFNPSRRCVHDLLQRGVGRLPVTRCRLERDDTSLDAYLNWNEYPTEIDIENGGNDLWTGRACGKGKYRLESHEALCIAAGKEKTPGNP